MTEYLGINNALNSASNTINNTLENYHIKDTFNKAVDYTKKGGEYVFKTNLSCHGDILFDNS